jgi:two-component system chemotaxis response regulator CheB
MVLALVQDGAGLAERLRLVDGCPVVLLRDVGDAREVTADESALGCSAAVALPDCTSLSSIWSWSGQLMAQLRVLRKRGGRLGSATRAREGSGPALVAIAISTGGPPALEQVFGDLAGADLPPIVIVQHMPDGFVTLLAQRLTNKTRYPVEVARDFQLLESGHAYLAPATHHLAVGRKPEGLCARLKDSPAVRGHRPSAEILFESLLSLGLKGVGVVMTGMGGDGAQGLLHLRKAGWDTAGQDEATCAVYGMPKTAKEVGATDLMLPLGRIGAWIRQRAARSEQRVPI